MIRIVKKYLKLIYDKITISQTKKEIEKAITASGLLDDRKKLSVLKAIVQTKQLSIIDNEMSCEAICFSKDRVMQLHALLMSYYKYVKNPVKLTVLYTFSNERHQATYDSLIKLFVGYNICFVKEKDFKNDLESLLNSIEAKKCFFMTDDALFIDDVDLADFIKYNPSEAIPCLTKGLDLTYCFTYDWQQALPRFIYNSEVALNQKCWNWGEVPETSPDWAYPLSLDATLFEKTEVEIIIKNTLYKAPNTLESNMQFYLELFNYRKGICFDKVKYVNVPCNLVQTEIPNKTTGEYDIEFLLEKWEQGYRIHFEEYYQQDCKVVQKSRYNFVKR